MSLSRSNTLFSKSSSVPLGSSSSNIFFTLQILSFPDIGLLSSISRANLSRTNGFTAGQSRAPGAREHGAQAQLCWLRGLASRQRFRPCLRRRCHRLRPRSLSPRHQLLRHLSVCHFITGKCNFVRACAHACKPGFGLLRKCRKMKKIC